MSDVGATQGLPEAARPVLTASKLFLALLYSFLFCAFLALGGGLGAETLGVWIGWMIGCALWWLLFALLQWRWWRRGDTKFWRPIYAYSLIAFMIMTVVPLVLLLVPPIRRWLSRKLKPYESQREETLRMLTQLRDSGVLSSRSIGWMTPTALDNGQRSPRELLAALVRRVPMRGVGRAGSRLADGGSSRFLRRCSCGRSRHRRRSSGPPRGSCSVSCFRGWRELRWLG
jgi:hypothetical protein